MSPRRCGLVIVLLRASGSAILAWTNIRENWGIRNLSDRMCPCDPFATRMAAIFAKQTRRWGCRGRAKLRRDVRVHRSRRGATLDLRSGYGGLNSP
jgi:hypothetical protein